MEENEITQPQTVQYTEENVIHLSDMEHVRTRPGMYIGRLGDGSHAEDGIYVLLKEVIDNSIDEFKMNSGKRIEVTVEDNLRCTNICSTSSTPNNWWTNIAATPISTATSTTTWRYRLTVPIASSAGICRLPR